MSDWEIVENKGSRAPSSEWEVVSTPAPQNQPNQESLLGSLARAPFRLAADVGQGGMNFLKNIPGLYESAKTEVPGAFDVLKQHPRHAAMQAFAGGNELINKLAQLPLNVAQYGANRLNLLPQSVPSALERITPEDTTESTNRLFGQPQYAGESLLRGAVRDIPETFLGAKTASFLNPTRYTAKNIAENIVKAGKEQSKKHTDLYNSLWKDAKNEGYENVPIDNNLLSNNFDIIKKYKTQKEYKSLQDFMKSPTLENAQKAQSDMGIMKRNMEEKSRTSALTSEEKALHEAAAESENHIESNMFKNKSGAVNEPLKNRYDYITNSYRKNVVPYKYNRDIQAYMHQELLPEQLKQRLSIGEFAAKKGKEHPELFRAAKIKKALIGLGVAGGIGAGGNTLYNYLNPQSVSDYAYGNE